MKKIIMVAAVVIIAGCSVTPGRFVDAGNSVKFSESLNDPKRADIYLCFGKTKEEAGGELDQLWREEMARESLNINGSVDREDIKPLVAEAMIRTFERYATNSTVAPGMNTERCNFSREKFAKSMRAKIASK